MANDKTPTIDESGHIADSVISETAVTQHQAALDPETIGAAPTIHDHDSDYEALGAVSTHASDANAHHTPPSAFAGAGADGLVPDPVAESGKFLKDDGTWAVPADTDDQEASEVNTDVLAFDGLLTGSDDTVQKALDTLDDHNHDSDYEAAGAISTHASDASAHHDKSHAHDGVDGSGTVAHSDTTGQGTDDHHAKSHNHTTASGAGAIATDQVFKAGDGGSTHYFQIDAATGKAYLQGDARPWHADCEYGYNMYGRAATYNSITCDAAGLSILSNLFMIRTYDDGAPTGPSAAVFTLKLGADYDEGEDFYVAVAWTAAATSGSVRWMAGALAVGEGEDMTATPEYASVTDATSGTAWTRQMCVIGPFDGSGATKQSCVGLVLIRDVAHADDDMSNEAGVIMCGLIYPQDRLGGNTPS